MIKQLKFQKLSPIASVNEVEAFESEFGFSLPSTFVEFCRTYNGGFPEKENTFYHVPEDYHEFHSEYGPTSQGPVGVTVDGLFGLSKELKAYDVRSEFLSLREESSIKLFPISFDLLGNSVVLRQDDLNGYVFWRDHELWEAQGVPVLFPIAPTLEQFYNSLTDNPYTED